MASVREQQQKSVNYKILHLLEGNPEMSTRELARSVGISNGGAFYVVDALVKKGLIKLENFRSTKNKGRYAYILTPSGLAEKATLTSAFLRIKREEYEALKQEIKELENDIARTAVPANAAQDDFR